MFGTATPARLAISFVACALVASTALAQEAGDVLRRSAAVMGAADLKSIRYTAEGTGYTFGQAYKPGMPWPKITVHSLVRTINYDSSSMRDEIVLSRGKPLGGGEIHRIPQSVHTDTFLMAYLPKEKLLIEADAYTPGAPNAPPPATPNALNVNLIENLERLALDVERIVPIHGRVVSLSELYTAAAKTMPRR